MYLDLKEALSYTKGVVWGGMGMDLFFGLVWIGLDIIGSEIATTLTSWKAFVDNPNALHVFLAQLFYHHMLLTSRLQLLVPEISFPPSQHPKGHIIW